MNVASTPGFTGEIARLAVGPSRSVTIEPEVFGVKLGSVGLPSRPDDLRGAMAAAASKVARVLGKPAKNVGTVRTRLVRAGIVEARGYGKVGFSIPYMREYLRANEDAIRDDLGIGR